VSTRKALDDRQWRVLTLVAEQGVLDTVQSAVLVGVSRPTAHRLLDGMYAAGLLARHVTHHGRDHRWYYEVTRSAEEALARAAHRQRRPMIRGIWDRQRAPQRQHRINQFFVDLAGYARRHGQAELFRWWHRVDACHWLEDHGVIEPWCDGCCIWIEDATTIRFTLHWTVGGMLGISGVVRLTPRAIVTGYTDTVQLDAVLVVGADRDEEYALHELAAARPMPAVLGTTTRAVLATHPDGPAGPVWATRLHQVDDGARRRLINVSSDR
jgi:DNA-binding MarR family transcriptional regulator